MFFIIAASTSFVYYNLIYYICGHINFCFSCCLYHFWLHLIVQQLFHLLPSYHVFVYWTTYAGDCISLRQTIPVPCKHCVQKLLMITFPSSFIFFITCWQYSITISYAMLTNNILISFDHPLCNLKHIAFLIIPLHNVSKSFPLCFLHLAWQAVFFASRYFSLHMFPCFHSFHSFCFSLTHSVSLDTDPPSKPQQSIFLCF